MHFRYITITIEEYHSILLLLDYTNTYLIHEKVIVNLSCHINIINALT